MIVICIKQRLTTFEAQFMKKLSNTEAELKKSVAYKKKRLSRLSIPLFTRKFRKTYYFVVLDRLQGTPTPSPIFVSIINKFYPAIHGFLFFFTQTFFNNTQTFLALNVVRNF